MIPKTLLTAFLSIRVTTNLGPPSSLPSAEKYEVEAVVSSPNIAVYTPSYKPDDSALEQSDQSQHSWLVQHTGIENQQQPLFIEQSSGDVSVQDTVVFPVRLKKHALRWL